MAKEAGLTLKACWQQVIKACYLDSADPIKKWQSVSKKIERIKTKLNPAATKAPPSIFLKGLIVPFGIILYHLNICSTTYIFHILLLHLLMTILDYSQKMVTLVTL